MDEDVKIIFPDKKKVVPVVRRRRHVDRQLHLEHQNPIVAAPTRASAPMHRMPASNAPIANATSGVRSGDAPVASGATSAGADSSGLGQEFIEKIMAAGDERCKRLQEKRKDKEIVQHTDALHGLDLLSQRVAIAKANTMVQRGMHPLLQINERGRK